jgi:hypothetical protein
MQDVQERAVADPCKDRHFLEIKSKQVGKAVNTAKYTIFLILSKYGKRGKRRKQEKHGVFREEKKKKKDHEMILEGVPY